MIYEKNCFRFFSAIFHRKKKKKKKIAKQTGTYRWVHSTVDIGHMLTLSCLPKLNKYVHHLAMDTSPDQLYCGIQSVNGPNIPIALVHT